MRANVVVLYYKLRRSGAFLPVREIRNCVPEFSVVNIIFLYLTVYNTGGMEN